MTAEAIGGLLIVLASLLFGGVVVLGKIATRGPDGLPVPAMLSVRFLIAAALLVPVLMLQRIPLTAAPGERGRVGALGLMYALEASLFFLGIQYGEAAAVTLLFFIYPVFVTVAWMALGRGAPGRLVAASLVCAVGGAAIVVASGGGLAISALGVVFALGAAVSYSTYLLLVDTFVRRTDPLTTAGWVALFAGMGLLVYAVATGEWRTPAGAGEWWPLLGMGAATAAAFACIFAGLRRLGPVRTAIVAATEPLAAAVLAFVFLDEPLRAGVALGGVMILAGAVAASLARGRAPAETTVP